MPWTVGDVERFKHGLSDAEKRQWVEVANSVLSRCLERGGEQSACEASAIRQANGVAGNIEHYHVLASNYIVRQEVHRGRKHLVVPVVMMVEGVHSGSHGPLLHLAEDLGRFVGAWNGIPVSVQHPEENGVSVSANQPGVIDSQVVGRVFNTAMDNGKLRAEAWLDEAALSRVSPEALEAIMAGRPLDVSVGVFTEDDYTSGEWNGERYEAVARHHRPDHLALLPGGTGACSWADGCGVRVHSEGGGDVKEDLLETLPNTPTLEEVRKDMAAGGFSVNEMGYRECSEKIQRKLDRMDDDTKLHYLEEVFDDKFIYRVEQRGGGEGSLWQRGYAVSDDGTVEFTGESVAVTKRVEYETMEEKEEEVMANTEKKPCCPEKVELLIQAEHTKFDEGDREWLLTLSEEQIGKLEVEPPVAPREPDEAAILKMSQEQAIKVLQERFGDPEKAMALFPKEIQEQLSFGLRAYKAERTRLIKHITENAPDVYTAEELEARSMDELEKLARLVKPKVDYSPMGPTPQPSAYADEGLYPIGVE